MTALLLKTNKTDFEQKVLNQHFNAPPKRIKSCCIQPFTWVLKVLIQHLPFESFLFVLSSNAVILVLLKFTPY